MYIYLCRKKRKVGKEGILRIGVLWIYLQLIINVLNKQVQQLCNCAISSTSNKDHVKPNSSWSCKKRSERLRYYSNLCFWYGSLRTIYQTNLPYKSNKYHWRLYIYICNKFGQAGRWGQEALARLYYTGHNISTRCLKQNNINEL